MKKISQKLLDLKLKWKFFYSFLIAALIPISFFSYYAYENTKNIMLQQSYRNMETSLAQANKNIQTKLNVYKDASSLIYMNKTIQDYLYMDYFVNGHEDLYYYLRRYVNEILTINPEILKFSIYTTNLSVPQDYYYIYRADDEVVKEEWYQTALDKKGKAFFLSTDYNSDGKLVYYLVRHLNYYSYGVMRNVLKMEIEEESLYSLISETSHSDQFMIIDGDNKVVSCKDKSLIGTSIYDVLKEYKGNFENNLKERTVYDGEEMLISCLSTNMGWKTISLASLSEINANAKRSAMNLILVALLAVFTAGSLSTLMSYILSKRINKLMVAVQTMKAGVFGLEIKDKGKDEVGLLAEAFSEMSIKVDYLIKEIYEKELIKKSVELNLLQEQVNPHFLYNALSSITSFAIRSGDKQIIEMVQHLADFYRISLNNGRNILSIRDEINLLKSYLSIQQIRFGDMVLVNFDLQESLLDCKTIKLILQPLVENSIHHAIGEDQGTLQITVKLYEDDKGIVFEITDNGKGMEEKMVTELNTEIQSAIRGYGLKNVSIRIQLQYGKDYGVQVFSELNVGTRVVIHIPKVER
ncbi:HAMP domain-containing protein [Anaerocolumna sedimenticola]|uniref:HAMP domain-containing protein n=1 Tax=Anaerocolumna sedimenticola TaxID=2696063 RepID=A0A6P1TKA2_9FIRM|nr:sensor histidine kinase [Anaerocolumna sedimenticola]QHQ60336.1 HAMP domain-containing protein [Anaerocolumna sedimenticola]